MTRLTDTFAAGTPAAAQAAQPRDDIVVERPEGDGRFLARAGPFASYQRTISDTTSVPSGASGSSPVQSRMPAVCVRRWSTVTLWP